MMSYPVMEHFYTLQGEGAHSGRAAYFIRLGGCDVGCVWCDVKESWPIDAHPIMTVDEIVGAAAAHPGRIAVITGGEPAMHDLEPLTAGLKAAGFQIHIETSGTRLLTGAIDWVTLSPKKFKAPLPAVMPYASELKVVIFHPSDFAWAEQHASMVSSDCRLYLQPEWSKHEQLTPLILNYIHQHPQWTLSLQTHKYLNIP
jgi:organic radical activating enzyme